MAPDGSLALSVTVTNTGDRPCRETVQLYLADPVAQVTRPLVELTDWRLVDLAPGESRRSASTCEPSSSPMPVAT